MPSWSYLSVGDGTEDEQQFLEPRPSARLHLNNGRVFGLGIGIDGFGRVFGGHPEVSVGQESAREAPEW